MWVKPGLPIFLYHPGDGLLDKVIQQGGNTQWTRTAVGLGNGDPPNRLRSVGLPEQLLSDIRPLLAEIIRQFIHGEG